MAQKTDYPGEIALLVDSDIASLGDNAAFQTDEQDNTTNGFDDVLIYFRFALTSAGTGDVTVHLWWDNDPGTGDRIDGAGAAKASFTPANIVDSIPIMVKVANGTATVRTRPVSIRDILGMMPRKWGCIVENQGGAAFGGSGKYLTADPIRYIEA